MSDTPMDARTEMIGRKEFTGNIRPTATPRETNYNEISELVDKIHAELMRQRDISGSLWERFGIVLTSPSASVDKEDIMGMESPLGNRLNDMYYTLLKNNYNLIAFRDAARL